MVTIISSNYAASGNALEESTSPVDGLLLETGSFLLAENGTGLLLGGTGNSFDLTVDGLIRGSTSGGHAGLWMEADNDASISISKTGSIEGQTGIVLDSVATISVGGSVLGTAGPGIEINGSGSMELVNSGRIRGGSAGLWFSDAAVGTHTITNAGLIEGSIAVSSPDELNASEVLTNNGVINGAIVLGGGADVVHNETGIIYGTIDMSAGQDEFYGSSTGENVSGGDDFDILDGGGGDDTLAGGTGDDIYFVDSAGDIIIEEAGDISDYVYTTVSYTLATGVEIEALQTRDPGEKTALKFVLNGAAGTDVQANAGDNTISALQNDGFVDTLQGLAGNDTYLVGDVTDQILDSAGVDTVRTALQVSLVDYIGVENVVLTGSTHAGATGNFFANQLTGNAGRNALAGAAGDDTLTGGAGADLLTGGAGRDIFDFNAVTESGLKSARDTILDFRSGYDHIDLRTIDAVAGGADNAFHLLARGTPTSAVDAGGIGYYWFDRAGTADDLTVLRLNIDRDADIEMSIAITGLLTMKTGDFLL